MNTCSLTDTLARNSSSLFPGRRSLLSRGLVLLFASGLFAGCAAPSDGPEAGGAGGAGEGDAPALAASPGAVLPGESEPGTIAVPVEEGCPSAEKILEVKGCPDCTVLRVAEVDLPMIGRSACTAKILDEAGEASLLTILDDGSVAKEADLMGRERELYRAKYGALTPELARALASADPEESIPVWIWARMTLDYPAKEAAVADPAIGQRFAAEARKIAGAARAPIRAELSRRGLRITEEDGVTPMLRAIVPARALWELAKMPEIARLGSDEYPGQPLSTAWYQTDHADAAAALSTGLGQGICFIEANRPDDTSQLEIQDTASPTGAPYWHIRMTSGIARNTSTTEMASAAQIFIADWDAYTPTPSAPSVHQWCMNRGVSIMNFSWTFTDGSPGGLTGVDMQFDYLAKLWPYPLYVPAAGNKGCNAGFDTVQNRGFNSLVVGGSNDQGDTNVANDTIYDCSSWRNPTSTHSDRELPYMVAPAVNVDSAGLVASGTSLAAPQVAGAVALMAARGVGFSTWPEMKRAAILATSVRNVDGGALTSLYAGDIKDGAGALDALLATQLADPANYRYPASAAATNGYYGTSINFTSDFTGSVGNPKWNLLGAASGRMRVAIAFDGSATCQPGGMSCTADTLDGDLDLQVFDAVTGAMVCASTTYDSSWEMCDFAPVANRQYRAELRKYTTTAASTYLGVAWYSYN